MNDTMIDSVISTRIRLARNLRDLPFPSKISAGQANLMASRVFSAFDDGYKLHSLARLGEAEAGALVEKHLISKELVNCPFGSVIVSDDESVSIMLCEEDHIREQVIMRGFKPEETYKYADSLDDRIGEAVDFAFTERLGYLTACPTNLGTGMRASVMMFLPALTITDRLKENAGSLGMFNITLRGVYGEGSDAAGFVYQVSNQRTLGLNEQQILELVKTAANHLADAEERARDYLMATDEMKIKDEIMRSYGIASNAYKLTSRELIRYAAFIKLGAYYKMIPVKKVFELDALTTSMAPFNLISSADRPLLRADECDVYRAAVVRESLKTIVG